MFLRRGGKNIKVRTIHTKAPASPLLLLCAESVNMLEGLTEDEAERYFTDHADVIPLYEIKVAEVVEPYQSEVSQDRVEQELGRVQEALEKELAVSQHVSADGQPRPIMVAMNLPTEFKKELTRTLREYKDMFTWSYEDMRGFDPQFYQHNINLPAKR